MVYLVSYDLNKIKDYKKLYEAISKLGNFIHPLDSLFLVNTSLTHAQLTKIIDDAVDKDDTYLVMRAYPPSGGRLDKKYWDWLNANFPVDALNSLLSR